MLKEADQSFTPPCTRTPTLFHPTLYHYAPPIPNETRTDTANKPNIPKQPTSRPLAPKTKPHPYLPSPPLPLAQRSLTVGPHYYYIYIPSHRPISLTAANRPEIARRRITRILSTYTVANGRTLEQKIADAGPGHLRVDPHILTTVRNDLLRLDFIRSQTHADTPWFHLTDTPLADVERRLNDELLPIHRAINDGDLTQRMGQALEIAILKALTSQTTLGFLGDFSDLPQHDDSTLYSKVEPPNVISGRSIAPRNLDFVLGDLSAPVGVEVKNVRPWIYPQSTSVRDLLSKCCELDAVPLLIARRIAYVTFKLLHPCGVLFHQTYNQRFPSADQALAERAANKHLLGFHDIRVGNEPDSRLTKFVETLPTLIEPARAKFDEFKDLLCDYGSSTIDYPSFAARVRRRLAGEPEDYDHPPDEDESLEYEI